MKPAKHAVTLIIYLETFHTFFSHHVIHETCLSSRDKLNVSKSQFVLLDGGSTVSMKEV